MELRERRRVIGRISGSEFELPLTQEQFGEAMGITSVHVNRILNQLQNAGVVKVRRGRRKKSRGTADFDGFYLHLDPQL